MSLHFHKIQTKRTAEYPLIIHYTHEPRFKHYKLMIHRIWQHVFRKTPISTRRLIIGTRNNQNLTKELVRRSPYIASSKPKQSTRNSSSNTHHSRRKHRKPSTPNPDTMNRQNKLHTKNKNKSNH